MPKLIDAHIHLEKYTDREIIEMLKYRNLEGLITVSSDLESSKRNAILSRQYKKVHSAFGFHPEQPLPSSEDIEKLITWISQNKESMVAIGEVGLPYYERNGRSEKDFPLAPYIELLEVFIQLAKDWNKPIVLHAIYEDAQLVCNLLEKYSITKAHFHWFKGDFKTISRMKANGYNISITPDVVYEKEIQQLVIDYPLEYLMVETDGPWPFEGPFHGQRTHPIMIEESIKVMAKLKSITLKDAYNQLLQNTKTFYRL